MSDTIETRDTIPSDAPPALGQAVSFKPEFLVQGAWCTNAQRFATYEEAKSSALSRFQRWTMPSDYRAMPSDEPVNYRWTPEKGDESL